MTEVARYRAVIFDLGGVVLDSPLDAIAAYETANAIPPGAINRAVAQRGATSAWARHERGEIDIASFCEQWETELADEGLVVEAAEVMARIELTLRPRPRLLDWIRRLRTRGIKVGAVTNSWKTLSDAGIDDEFDVVVHSWREGVRKPEPAIYHLALERLGVKGPEAVYLDDIGANLKPAQELGMNTFKVTDEEAAVTFLASLFGLLATP